MNRGIESWSRDRLGEDDEEEEEEDIVYDDDEDEFGLPSITSMRKKQSQSVGTSQPKPVDPGGGLAGNASTLGVGLGNNRQRANSSDIAEERGVPMYPTAGTGEGKILRPQYKEILKGMNYAFQGWKMLTSSFETLPMP